MKRIALALALAALATAAPLRAQAPPPEPTPPPSSSGGRYRALGLSPDQMRRVQELHRRIGDRLRDLERSLREHRRALETQYREYTLDMEQIHRLNAQINETQREILVQHTRMHVELRKILTADQFARLKENMRARRGSREAGPRP